MPWIAFYYKGERLRRQIMSTTPASRPSAARMTRHRERRRQGSHCITIDVSQSERNALVVSGYLSEEDGENGAAIKKAIEAVLSDIELDVQSETAERNRARG
jgi:hypothetical protein